MTAQAFLSRQIVTPEGIRPGAVLVEGERVSAVVPTDQVPQSAQIHDFRDVALLPGLVDSHVHINEPGRTEWEGFETATRAAAAGGYTMLVDMPLNSVPATTTLPALEAKRKAATGKCWVDWAAWGGVVADHQEQIAALARAGVLGFKCFLVHPGIDEFTMVTERELHGALPHVASTGLPLLVHAELPGPVEAATALLADADWSCYTTYLRSRPDDAELEAIRLMLSLCKEYRFRLHVVHLSSSWALDELWTARAAGLAVTVETCPHYLRLEAENIGKGATLCKCAPPIRSRSNREKLWQGLREGVIDMVVTDHSPCPPALKRIGDGSFRTAWGGIASLSMALPVMWTEANQRGFGLTDLVRWMAEEPGRLAGCHLRKGRIAAGYDADLVAFDSRGEFTVTEDRLHYRHPVSPYLGQKLRGVVKATYVRGRAVFGPSGFAQEPSGQEFVR
jgi:allantoinase